MKEAGETPYPKGPWADTFSKHLLAMESSFNQGKNQLHPDCSVYLAGVVARKLDPNYWKTVETHFLVENPEEILSLIRRHYLFIGQNAPIVTVSRYNAEHLLFEIAMEGISSDTLSKKIRLRIPARYFGIASTYSRYAGNQILSEILEFFSRNLEQILPDLTSYLWNLKGRKEVPELSPIPTELWERFSKISKEMIRKKSQSQVSWNDVFQGIRGSN